MFELSVERVFCAAHALVIRGERERTHGHNWHLTVTIGGGHLDADGMLVDFHALEKVLDAILAPMQNADLNELPPFAGHDALNPSAELIAKHIAERLMDRLESITGHADPVATRHGTPKLLSVRLTEAPGCSVVYRPA